MLISSGAPPERARRRRSRTPSVDGATVSVYEKRAEEWRTRRGGARDALGSEFRAAAGPGLIADLGCGTGRYFDQIGPPLVGLDVTAAMLGLASHRQTPLVRGDLEALPFRTGRLEGAFARHSYLHVPKGRFPAAVGELRRVIRPGGMALLSMIEGDYQGHELPDDDFPGRFFAFWTAHELVAAFEAAGFVDVRTRRDGSGIVITASC